MSIPVSPILFRSILIFSFSPFVQIFSRPHSNLSIPHFTFFLLRYALKYRLYLTSLVATLLLYRGMGMESSTFSLKLFFTPVSEFICNVYMLFIQPSVVDNIHAQMCLKIFIQTRAPSSFLYLTPFSLKTYIQHLLKICYNSSILLIPTPSSQFSIASLLHPVFLVHYSKKS